MNNRHQKKVYNIYMYALENMKLNKAVQVMVCHFKY